MHDMTGIHSGAGKGWWYS